LSKASKAGVIPAGLGAKGGEYNKFFIDSFTRIVIRNEDVKAVVQEQGAALDTFMKAANVPCWLPDPVGTAACTVK
jgi:multiple sugar transport system substrate-binding protein